MSATDGIEVDTERLRNLEEAVAAVKRSREALAELSDVGATIKRGKDALKDLGNALRREIAAQQGQGTPASSALVDHRLQWITPVSQPLMLCSQVQRSGGTLLTRLFDGHPSCFVHPSELHWARLGGTLWPHLVLSPAPDADDLLAQLDEGWPKQFAMDGYHKYSNWTHRSSPGEMRRYPFIFDVALQRKILARQLAERGCRSQREAMDLYLTSLFNAWLDYQNLYHVPKRWVTAFQPRLVMRSSMLDQYFTDYPDGLLVTIVREPGAWLASFMRHVDSEDLDMVLDKWIGSAEASVRAHEARPDQVVVVIFEELVERTEVVMRALCRRMDIAFTEVLLQPTYNSMPVLSDSSHALTTGIDPGVTNRHQSTLSAAQHDAVARKATARYAEIRKRFGVAHAR